MAHALDDAIVLELATLTNGARRVPDRQYAWMPRPDCPGSCKTRKPKARKNSSSRAAGAGGATRSSACGQRGPWSADRRCQGAVQRSGQHRRARRGVGRSLPGALTLRVLLDTHIALWAVVGSRRLAPRANELILAADDVFVSVASRRSRKSPPSTRSAEAMRPYRPREPHRLSVSRGMRCSIFARAMRLRWNGAPRFSAARSTGCWSRRRLSNPSR